MERRKPVRVVVGYPVGGSVTLPFHSSMLKLVTYETLKPDRERLLGKVTHSQGLYVADNRNLLIQRLLETEADWLLQIDTDIEFPHTIIETMLRIAGTDKKVLGASVPLGSEQFPSSAFFQTPTAGIWECAPQVVGEVMECDGLATAVMLTHRSVFEDIAGKDGQCWMNHMYIPARLECTTPREFRYLSVGEDLAFCVRAKQAGHRIWCAYVPGLGHYKTRRVSHDVERAAAMADQDAGVGELVKEAAVCA